MKKNILFFLSLLIIHGLSAQVKKNYKKVHQSYGYNHYSNHQTQQHYKPQNNTYKTHSSQESKTLPPIKQDSVSSSKMNQTNNTTTISDNSKPVLSKSVFSTTIISKDSLKNLKAIIVSADVDGPNGSATQDYIKGMKELANFLKSNGIAVEEFYCPNDNWDKIKSAAKGAHFFIYSGHGVYDGTVPPKWVGGFCLSNNTFISSQQVQTDLSLVSNAVVVFNHACFTAGSSAIDNSDIGVQEAHRRVAMYAHPFVESGFGCYFSNNFYEGAKGFFDGFLAGNSVNDIYVNATDNWCNVLEYQSYEFNKKYKIGISNDKNTSYDVAMVANPSLTVYDLLKTDR